MDQDAMRRRLIAGLWGYEIAAISICIGVGVMLAREQGGSVAMAAPLILIAAAESLRIPVSAWAMQLSRFGQVFAAGVLLMIAVGSFEGLSLAFEQFVNNRTINVMRAENAVSDARTALEAKEKNIKGAEMEMQVAQKSLDDLNEKIKLNRRPERPSGNTSKCRNRRGVEYSCSADATTAKAFAADVDAFLVRSRKLDAEAKSTQDRVASLAARFAELQRMDLTPLVDNLRHAERERSIVLRLSPMHRLASSIWGVKISDLTEAQFETVKKWAVFGLAGAFAILSMLVSIVAHFKPHDGSESKLSRSVRAYIARRRKKIVRIETVEVLGPEREVIVEKRVEVPGPERVIIKWIAYDMQTGRKINPDLTLGEPRLASVPGGKR